MILVNLTIAIVIGLLLARWSCVKIPCVQLNGFMFLVWKSKSAVGMSGTVKTAEKRGQREERERKIKEFYDHT